jgi:hypothetical protein
MNRAISLPLWSAHARVSRSPRQQTTARCAAQGSPPTMRDLADAVVAGAVERVRPKIMTVVTTIAALCRSCGARAPAAR